MTKAEIAEEERRQAMHYAEHGNLVIKHSVEEWPRERDYPQRVVVEETVIFTGTRKEAEVVQQRYQKALEEGCILAPLVYALDQTYRASFEFRKRPSQG